MARCADAVIRSGVRHHSASAARLKPLCLLCDLLGRLRAAHGLMGEREKISGQFAHDGAEDARDGGREMVRCCRRKLPILPRTAPGINITHAHDAREADTHAIVFAAGVLRGPEAFALRTVLNKEARTPARQLKNAALLPLAGAASSRRRRGFQCVAPSYHAPDLPAPRRPRIYYRALVEWAVSLRSTRTRLQWEALPPAPTRRRLAPA